MEIVPADVLSDEVHRDFRPLVQRQGSDSRFEGHPDPPGAGRRQTVENGGEPLRPPPEYNRTQIAVYRHRGIVERPRSRGRRAAATRDVRHEKTRSAFCRLDDRERKIHGGSMAGGLISLRSQRTSPFISFTIL